VLRDQLLRDVGNSTPQKVPLFGRAASFQPKRLCTKQMRSKWKRPLRRS
jgi:hypothetical protein